MMFCKAKIIFRKCKCSRNEFRACIFYLRYSFMCITFQEKTRWCHRKMEVCHFYNIMVEWLVSRNAMLVANSDLMSFCWRWRET